MSNPVTEATAKPAESEPKEANPDGAGDAGDQPDFESKYKAQQKVNRDLEAKLKASLTKEEAEELRAEIARLKGEEEKFTAEQEKAKVRSEALAVANQRILKANLRALATGVLADPTDAHLYINLADFEVSDDGEVDEDALKAAIEDLVERKPHLAAKGGTTTVINSPTSGREGQQQTEEQKLVSALDAAEKAHDFETVIGLKQRLSALKAEKPR